MTEGPLSGFNILNTRPAEQALATQETIESLGGRAIHLPSVLIQTLATDPQDLAALIDCSDILLFCSSNAITASTVSAVIERLRVHPRLTIGAIGKATALTLTHAGVKTVFFPHHSHHSEGLLACQELRSVEGKTIVIIKGQGGRQLLTTQLRQQGAMVKELITYRRLLPDLSQQQCHQIWCQQPIDIILGMSQECIDNLFSLFGPKGKLWLTNTRWLLWNKRLCKRARQIGIKQFVVADNNDIFQTLVNWAQCKEPRNG